MFPNSRKPVFLDYFTRSSLNITAWQWIINLKGCGTTRGPFRNIFIHCRSTADKAQYAFKCFRCIAATRRAWIQKSWVCFCDGNFEHTRARAQAGGMTQARLQISPGTDRRCLFAQASRKHATKEQIQMCDSSAGDSIHSVSSNHRHQGCTIPVHCAPKHTPNAYHRLQADRFISNLGRVLYETH